jgi:subtilase family serine protease
MEARYLPPRARSDALAAWLRSQGLTVSKVDANHTFVSVTGTVAQLAGAFGVTFARVSTPRGEFTSALTPPSLPASVGVGVLSIDGLQAVTPFHPAGSGYQPSSTNVPALAPVVYSFPGDLNGSGVTIAISGMGVLSTSDINTFWTDYLVPDTLSNLTIINSGGSGEDNSLEDTLDVSMASSVAPSAKIRLYESDDFFGNFQQILEDQPSYPAMTVATASYGVDVEADLPEGYILS